MTAHVIVTDEAATRVIRLRRPEKKNAITEEMFRAISEAIDRAQNDPRIRCLIITGGSGVFTAGNDIEDLLTQGTSTGETPPASDLVKFLYSLAHNVKPIIAAVSGYALGGGCELAMICDFIIASDTAKFGQPEITLGTIPGIGGTQRLTRAIGKSKAMDLCLTGRMMDAAEAERSGLVSRIIPADKLMEEALAAAEKIASMSRPAAAMAKEAVNRAFETPLSEGMNVERNLFHSTFALEDRSEGMAAFIEKRKPVNKNR